MPPLSFCIYVLTLRSRATIVSVVRFCYRLLGGLLWLKRMRTLKTLPRCRIVP
nr:MAG TPA: hypothetical protein [Caudoviricetes sp.]